MIEEIGPCRAIISDLQRMRDTAARIEADAAPTERLREISGSDGAGRIIENIRAEEMDACLVWRANTAPPSGGEAWDDFETRVRGLRRRRSSRATVFW